MRTPLALLLASLLLAPAPALANPKGGQVRSGSAHISESAGRVDVHQQSDSAVLSWDSFDIDAGEVTQFHQPGKDSVAINRIFQGDASKILGSLQANGHVYLINPHGILFGREAQVNVHALLATTTLDGGDLAGKGGFDPSAKAADGGAHREPGPDPERHRRLRLPGRALREERQRRRDRLARGRGDDRGRGHGLPHRPARRPLLRRRVHGAERRRGREPRQGLRRRRLRPPPRAARHPGRAAAGELDPRARRRDRAGGRCRADPR